jgi:hypothetical protein
MTPTPVRTVAALEAARRHLEAHVRSLRRKLDRRRARGEATGDLVARISSEEDLIRRMRRRGE